MRETNAIDSWRGLALVAIFIDHIPGSPFKVLTPHNIVLADFAELFVFLAGWALRLSTTRFTDPVQPLAILHKLWTKTFKIYVAQIFISEIALWMISAFALYLGHMITITGQTYAISMYMDPMRAHVGLALITYQISYFEILPLYVVLTFLSPLLVLLYIASPPMLVIISVSIYALAELCNINIPLWPEAGHWYFSPYAWQFIYVIGFLCAGKTTDIGAFARRHLALLKRAAWLILIIGFPFAVMRHFPHTFPHIAVKYLFDKTYMSPDRVLSILSLVVVGADIYDLVKVQAPLITDLLSAMGRNSLVVFCAGSLLSLLSRLLRVTLGGSFAIDAISVAVGVSTMLFIAKVAEWRPPLQEQAHLQNRKRQQALPSQVDLDEVSASAS